jgi:hypothetical protein
MINTMFLDKSNVIAVVGVSPNKEKYGYRVYKTLKDNGFEVYAINPAYDEVDGERIYHTLEDVGKPITFMITVAPHAVALPMAQKARELGIARIWMQPGSESQEAVGFCEQNGIECIYKQCIIKDGLKTDFTA